jgi:autotransporter strand-loop-strand O-heptosyltransferase
MKEELIEAYNTLTKINISPKKNIYNLNFIEGAFFEVVGDIPHKYLVIMSDTNTSKIIHRAEITNNMWTRANIKYFINWKIQVFDIDTQQLVFEHFYNAENKRVYIHLDSKAIGDTLAWFPYVKDFQDKHKCTVIVSTFYNKWFRKCYPELKFVNPGKEVHDLYAMYVIGFHYNDDHSVNYSKVPRDFKLYPLQQTCTDILGLNYLEQKPKIETFEKTRPIKDKYVVIAPHASSLAKYWNNYGGWQQVIDYLNSKDYRVMNISAEKQGDKWHDSKLGGKLKNVINMTGDLSIEERFNQIKHADLFIGLGSGLSWISWALGTKTILISGFSRPETEFKDCIRIFPEKGICNGCFNEFRLDPGTWDWCPRYRNTDRIFECTRTIKAEKVINAINQYLELC